MTQKKNSSPPKEEQQRPESEIAPDPSQPYSIIKMMLDSGMSDQNIRDNVGIFFLAGHETTASTLTWILGLLAMHPEIQEKARQEVLTKTPNGLTYESLKDLEYMDWIIHESMRLFPPVPSIGGRIINKETTIGDWKLPANTLITIDFISMLQNPKIWENPEEFIPERWAPEKLTKEQRTVWMPFSYGPRICIGMNFSLVEQKIFLGTVLREFSEITLSKGSVLTPETSSFIYSPDHKKLTVQFVCT